MADGEKRHAYFYDGDRMMGWNQWDGPFWHGTGSSVEERLYEAIEGMAELHARLGLDEARIADLESENANLRYQLVCDTPDCEEAQAARIAELEAEVARLRACEGPEFEAMIERAAEAIYDAHWGKTVSRAPWPQYVNADVFRSDAKVALRAALTTGDETDNG